MFVLPEVPGHKGSNDLRLQGSEIKNRFRLRKKVLLMVDMRVYFRVPRQLRKKEGNWMYLNDFNKLIDLWNTESKLIPFWEFITAHSDFVVIGFDMVRNIGNPAFKYVHIIKMKG